VTFFRFPLVLGASLASLIYALNIGSVVNVMGRTRDFYGLLTFTLAIPFFIGVHLFCESIQQRKERSVLVKFAAAMLVVGYFFTLEKQAPALVMPRYLQLCLAFTLGIPVLPFLFRELVPDAADFSRQLIKRLLVTFFLMSGILLILTTVFYVFGRYSGSLQPFIILEKSAIFLLFVPALWFFLGGIDILHSKSKVVSFKVERFRIVFAAVGLLFVGIVGYQLIDQNIDLMHGFFWFFTIWIVGTILCLFTLPRINLLWIPFSLSLILILTCAGPWSVYSVTKMAQLRAVRGLFQEAGVLDRSKAIARTEVPLPIRRRLSEQLELYHARFEVEDIHRLIWPNVEVTTRRIAAARRSEDGSQLARRTMGILGMGHVSKWDNPNGKYYSFTVDYPPAYDASQFDVISRWEVFNIYDGQAKIQTFQWKKKPVDVKWTRKSKSLTVSMNKKVLITVSISELIKRVESYLKSHPYTSQFRIPQEVMSLEKSNDRLDIKIYFDNVSAEQTTAGYKFSHFKSDLFIKFKKL